MSEEIEIIEPDDEQGTEIEVWIPGEMQPVSMLKCMRCYLHETCPEFSVDADCCALEKMVKYDITKPEGLGSLLQTMLSIQAKRVIRLAQWEDLEGGLPDPNVTKEIQELLNMMTKIKKMMKDEDSIVIHAKGKSSKGVIDKLFGEG